MLVLGRYAEQVLLIGPDIEVMVVKVHPDGKVRLGIKAPDDVTILRKELLADGETLVDYVSRRKSPEDECDGLPCGRAPQ